MSAYTGYYNAAFEFLEADILVSTNKMITDERIKGSSCECKNLVKYFAAIQYVQLIKIYTDQVTEVIDSIREGEGDWKGLFEYDKVKACLACKGIDLDALLEIYEVDSIIS